MIWGPNQLPKIFRLIIADKTVADFDSKLVIMTHTDLESKSGTIRRNERWMGEWMDGLLD